MSTKVDLSSESNQDEFPIEPGDADQDNSHTGSILYEILLHAEWPQEPELQSVKGHATNVEDGHSKKAASLLKGSWLPLFGSTFIPANFSRLTDEQLNWRFVVGGEGTVIAVLQDHLLEIRSSKDEYATVVGKCSVGKDVHPQWRKLAWSPDCSLLAVSHSDGSVDFFDALAFKLFTIGAPGTASEHDLADSLNSILFIETRLSSKTSWSFEVLLVDYKGILRSYFISPTDGYETSHTFNLTHIGHFKSGAAVTSVVYDRLSNLLVCGGPGVQPSLTAASSSPYATELGIAAFRLLNDAPYYRLSLTFDEEKFLSRSSSLLQWLPSFKRSSRISDAIFRLCLSPDSTLLAAVHLSGAITLWDFPSLRFRKMFPLEQQPHYDDSNPVFAHNLRKLAARDPFKRLVTDINWWSEKALIVARCSGTITVSSISNFENLLGSSAEWFEGFPQVSMAHDRGFFLMECENRLSSKRRSASVDDQTGSEDEDEDEDDYDSVVRRSMKMVKTAIYYMTDSERFQPPRRKPKFLTRTYRLLCLKATSPESLFARKLDNEEYGEALGLAKHFNLDCDLVFQRQWRNADVSVASIQDYLSKITKRSWVLHECLDRVPETLNANLALLEYGLRGTDLEALISIGEGTDEGKYILCDSERALCDESLDDYDTAGHARKAAQERQIRAKLLSKVNFKALTLDQKQLCITRQKLLRYLQRLKTYEWMLGGVHVAPDHFDAKFFRYFRTQSAVVAAVEFARQGNWRFVEAMFTYHGTETLPHRLAILSNFPEIMSPMEYQCLLPEAGCKPTDPPVLPWIQEPVIESDWVECKNCRRGLGQTLDDAADFIYEEEPDLKQFRLNHLEPQHLTDWYVWRANAVEKRSLHVDHALELVRLGMERSVLGLTALHDNLVTLEVLVYECFIDDSLRLKHLESMDDIDKLRLLMSRSSAEQFVKNVRRWLIPFLNRCDCASPGSGRKLMREYLLSIAKHDLKLCVKIFDQSRADQKDPIVGSVTESIALALDCIYACEENDQLDNARGIVGCLPIRSDIHSHLVKSFLDRLDSLEKHLAAAELLRNHDILKSIVSIRDCQKSSHDAELLLTLLTRAAGRKNPEVRETLWRELLEDVLELQNIVLHCIEAKLCLKIFVQSMLCSGRKENIRLAGELIVSNKLLNRGSSVGPGASGGGSGGVFRGIGRTSPPRISAKEASVLVISAAKEYFNSASDSDDPCMELARHCLRLVDEADDEIQAEIDLIDALPILSELGIKLLPLQVRLCENRLHLIEQVFENKPAAYKNSQKLMKLAHLMRVGQDVQLWGGQIHILVASAAFEAQDFVACYQACQYIVLKKYPPGWQVCFMLGQCDAFLDTEARRELLAFCAVHCCGERLEAVVCTRHKLEVRLLQSKLQKVISEFQQSDSEDTSSGHLSINQKTMKFVLQLQQFTNPITRQIFSTVGGSAFLENSMSWVQSKVMQAQNSSNRDAERHCNSDFERISIPSFYATLLPDCAESPLSPSYAEYTMPIVESNSPLSLGLLLLRLALLQETMASLEEDKKQDEKNARFSKFTTKVMLNVACSLLPHDTLLGFVHLISLNDPDLMEDCFERFPNTAVCLKLAVLCLSLMICQEAELLDRSKLFVSDPKEVAKLALRYANAKRKKADASNLLEKYVELLLGYKKKLADFVQGNVLRSLGQGVDVIRFSEDDNYKRETILGLGMSTDENTYKMAVSMAVRYHIPLWDLYMVHVEYLFCDYDASTLDIQKRIADLGIMPILLEDAPRLRDRLKNVVSLTIAGTDHARFLYYLSLLAQSEIKEDAKHVHSVSRLLTRLQSIVPGLDFGKLIYGTDSLLELLEPVVNGTNIKALLKTLQSIKSVLHKSVKASELYRVWLTKAFFEVNDENDDDSNKETVVEKKQVTLSKKKTIRAWMSRFDGCKEHFEHLEPVDLVLFVKGTILSENALEDIAVVTRSQMLSRTIKYANAELEKSKEGPSREAWTGALEQLVKSQRHLEWINSELVEETKRTGNSNIRRYLREFELRGPESASAILFDCIFDGQSVESLQRLVAIFPPEAGCDSTPGEMILEALSTLQNIIRNIVDDRSCWFTQRNPIEVLQAVVDATLIHVVQGGDLIDLNDVIERLLPNCTDGTVNISTRLIIIKLMEKICPDNSPHLTTLSGCKMRAIVADAWPDVQVIPEDLLHDDGKEALFRRILVECKSLKQFETLVQLLIDLLPLPSSNSGLYTENCWCQIMASILKTGDHCKYTAVIDVLRQARNITNLNLKCLQPLMDQLSQTGQFLDKLKFSLLTEHESLHLSVLEDAAQLNEKEVVNLDFELCVLLLERRLVSRTVATRLYRPLVDHILSELSFDQVKEIAGQLKADGHYAEAASLLVTSSGLPPGLQTFNSALGLLNR